MSIALPSSNTGAESPRNLEPPASPHPFHPRDFAYYEDAERRWMGVAIYGGILIGIPALVRGPPDNPLPISGFLLAAFGVVVVVIVAGVLLVLVGGEAALAALAAGLTLFVTGMILMAGVDTNWSWTTLGLAVVGSCCIAVGAGGAFRSWRLSTADEDSPELTPA